MTSRTSVLRLAAVRHPERPEALHLVLEEEDDNDGLLVVAEAERPQARVHLTDGKAIFVN